MTIKKICRLPHTHILYTHILGLSLGILPVIVLTFSRFYTADWLFGLCSFLLFALASYYSGGLLALISAILFFMPVSITGLIGQFLILFKWHFVFYAAGVIFGTTYNFLLFTYIRYFNKRILKISFAYNWDDKFNIIKSPKLDEAVKITSEEGIEPLYNYSVDPEPQNPYTILFVANPKICSRLEFTTAFSNRDDFDKKVDEHRKNSNNYLDDPIIKNKKLFYRTVDRAMRSFENDEVFGRPANWSCVRLLTIFDEEVADIVDQTHFAGWNGKSFGFAEAYQANVGKADIVLENLMVPLADMDLFLNDKLKQYQQDKNESEKILLDKIDVIYVISANENYDRSAAMYSDNPVIKDIYTGSPTELTVTHEAFSKSPGRIALNALTAWQKTFIHEFAHAMSVYQNGAIIDEYFDFNEASAETDSELQSVNRKERPTANDPIPALFTKYNELSYHSDRDHPSEKENWKGYFPQRCAKHIGCTMDKTIGPYQFDPLISDLMYDRLLSKRNR